MLPTSRTPLHEFVPSFWAPAEPDHEPFGPDDLILLISLRLMYL
jgi:hypothetical protein